MSTKYRVQVDVISKFSHTVDVVVEDGVDLDSVLDELESRGNHPDDVSYYLNGSKGVKIINFTEDGSGECEIECPDMYSID